MSDIISKLNRTIDYRDGNICLFRRVRKNTSCYRAEIWGSRISNEVNIKRAEYVDLLKKYGDFTDEDVKKIIPTWKQKYVRKNK